MSLDEKLSILVVDDDELIRRFIIEVLSESHNIYGVGSAPEAINYIKNTPVQLVISDIVMDGPTGIELLKNVKEIDRQILVILMTGSVGQSSAIEAVKFGAFDYIEKPVDENDLLSAVTRAQRHIRLEHEAKVAQIKSVQAEKLASLGSMAGSIAHEIVNPLAIISGSAHSMKKKLGRLTPAEDVTSLIEKSERIIAMTERIDNIITGLRNLARNDEEKAYEKVDLKLVIEDSLNVCTCIFREHGVRFDYTAWQQEMYVHGNRTQLSQVLVNLFNNAVHAVDRLEEKWIKLEVSKGDVDKIIMISVTDSGFGIPEENKQKIFEDFFTTKPHGEGTGFGLSLSHKIIESHQGKIYVDEGAHTKFTIELPVLPASSSHE